MSATPKARLIVSKMIDLDLPDLEFVLQQGEAIKRIREASVVSEKELGADENEMAKEARKLLKTPQVKFSASEATILVCWLLTIRQPDIVLKSRLVTAELNELDRRKSVVNISKTIGLLRERGLLVHVAETAGIEMNQHKSFRLGADAPRFCRTLVEDRLGKIA